MERNRVLDECASTNDLAKRLGESGAPHGTWISARRQTAGRGRQGRSWVSEEGNLFLSIVVRPERNFPVTWVPLWSGIQVAEAIRGLDSGKNVRLKWPNDVFLASADGALPRKAGGILCEGVGSESGTFVVVGIGLNCASAPSVDQDTASLVLPADAIRERIVAGFAAAPALAGLAALTDRYLAWSLYRPGDRIAWSAKLDPDAPLAYGEFLGLGGFGELRVRNAEGNEQSLWSEEVRVRAAVAR